MFVHTLRGLNPVFPPEENILDSEILNRLNNIIRTIGATASLPAVIERLLGNSNDTILIEKQRLEDIVLEAVSINPLIEKISELLKGSIQYFAEDRQTTASALDYFFCVFRNSKGELDSVLYFRNVEGVISSSLNSSTRDISVYPGGFPDL